MSFTPSQRPRVSGEREVHLMTITRTARSVAFAAMLFVGTSSTALAQPTGTAGVVAVPDDSLAQAKTLYAAAAYDESLAMLDRLTGGTPEDASAIAEYRVFCLLALGRGPEANRAIEGILKHDPFYRPSEAQVSPRIQSVIRDARRQLLPGIIQSAYADAKSAFDRKDPSAAAQFDRVITLLDDPDAKSVAALNDLRTVVIGFRDLSRAAAAPPETAAAAAKPTPRANVVGVPTTTTPSPSVLPQTNTPPPSALPNTETPPPATVVSSPTPSNGSKPAAAAVAPAAAPPGKAFYDANDKEVVPPVPTFQKMPAWSPARQDATQEFKGVLHIIIDERGNVISADMRQKAHPTYDTELVAAARAWKFRPALRGGVPVRYMKLIDITLSPPRRD